MESTWNVQSGRSASHLCSWYPLDACWRLIRLSWGLVAPWEIGLTRLLFPSVCRIRNTTLSQNELDHRELVVSLSYFSTHPSFSRLWATDGGYWWLLQVEKQLSEPQRRTVFFFGLFASPCKKRKEQVKTAMPFKLGCRSWKRGL